jgi:uncharacterized LabA/DUF88 family protein
METQPVKRFYKPRIIKGDEFEGLNDPQSLDNKKTLIKRPSQTIKSASKIEPRLIQKPNQTQSKTQSQSQSQSPAQPQNQNLVPNSIHSTIKNLPSRSVSSQVFKISTGNSTSPTTLNSNQNSRLIPLAKSVAGTGTNTNLNANAKTNPNLIPKPFLKLNNYAFIDCQNLWINKDRSWHLDWAKFREYLRVECSVSRAYLFIGFVSGYQKMYQQMQEAGFILLFKPIQEINGKVICNIDTEMVLQTMIQINNFDKAVIVSGDGDFTCLVDHLRVIEKLELLILPDHSYSATLEKTARERVRLISSIKSQISRDILYDEEMPIALVISE